MVQNPHKWNLTFPVFVISFVVSFQWHVMVFKTCHTVTNHSLYLIIVAWPPYITSGKCFRFNIPVWVLCNAIGIMIWQPRKLSPCIERSELCNEYGWRSGSFSLIGLPCSTFILIWNLFNFSWEIGYNFINFSHIGLGWYEQSKKYIHITTKSWKYC